MFEKELNNEQRKAVLQGDGPCLVLAGAGSGKTRTITYRVAYLISQGVQPKNILLVTFTNKAAKEMVDRVKELVGGETKLPWAGTFHHIGYRILKQYAPLLDYKNNFSILDSGDSKDLFKLCLKHEGIDRKQKRFPSAKVIQSIVSYARNAETTIHDVLDFKYPNWLEIADVIFRIAEDYNKRKKEANVMDFDDLLVNLHLLLVKSEKVRKRFSEQFQYVLVDEYQDTNKIQASIIRLFTSHHKNILVVGDDAQSIYSFRAADIQNILDFEKEYPDAKIFRLETNYRSTPNILDVANVVIDRNKKQYTKKLNSVLESFSKPELHTFQDNQEEGQFIAERILDLQSEGVDFKNTAVLFRAAHHSQALEMELNKRGIPYEYRGGIRFFERAHIKDTLSYLRVFTNRDDMVAWNRTLNMQIGIGPVAAQKIIFEIQNMLGSQDFSLQDVGASLPARAKIGWSDFVQIWNEMEKSSGTSAGLIRAIIKSKYAEYLENEFPDYRERLQDLEQMAIFAESQPEVETFLAEATLQENYSRPTGRQNIIARGDDEKIVLSTIHQAKGLEWDAVFVMHVAAGQFPNERALGEREGIEEERRLFYVAITRAKKYLHLSYPLMNGYNSLLGPSIFIDEIDRDLLSEYGLDSDDTVFDDPSDDVDDVVYIPEDGASGGTSFLKSISDL